MTRVLIVDDDEATRRSCSKALRLQDYEVLEARDMQEASEHMQANPCDVVLLDLCLPGILGIDGLALIRDEHPSTAVVMISGVATVDDAVECMKGGAVDMITKPVRVSRLIEVVAGALAPRAVPDTRGEGPPSERMRTNLREAARSWKLTERERQILEGVLRGLSNKEIAAHVRCSVRTVELHVTALLAKSGTDSRNALAAAFWLNESWA